MNQEFEIKPVKLVQDENSYGVALLQDNGNWEVIASFKYPIDAVAYFTQVLSGIGNMPNESTK